MTKSLIATSTLAFLLASLPALADSQCPQRTIKQCQAVCTIKAREGKRDKGLCDGWCVEHCAGNKGEPGFNASAAAKK